MRIILFLVLVLVSCSTTKVVNETRIFAAEMDALGNIYTLWNNNEVQLLDGSLEKKYAYSRNVGQITSIDPSNPQKILFFLENQSQIIFLDNTLSELNRLNINTEKYLDVTAAAMSNDNNIWIWDASNKTLVKINELGQELFKTELMTLFPTIQVDKIVEKGNALYLKSQDIVYVFSNLGVLKNKLPLNGATYIDYRNDGIIFYNGSQKVEMKLPFYEPKESSIALPKPNSAFLHIFFTDPMIGVTSLGVRFL